MKFNKSMLSITILSLFASASAQADTDLDSRISTRIIGGEAAEETDWGFIVPLVTSGQSASAGQFCGGSLIDSKHVLTAAHCVEGRDAGDIDVFIGIYDLSDDSSATRVSVANITAHPEYNIYGYGNHDVAILELAEEVSGTTIELATNSVLDGLETGDTLTVAGWGNTSTTSYVYPNILQQVDVPYVERSICQNAAASNDYSYIDESTVCAGLEEGGLDSCQGDSGGPLVVDDNGTLKLFGVVSWGIGCAQPDAYGVYANVAYFDDNGWIESNTSDSTTDDSNDDDASTGDSDADDLTSAIGLSGIEVSTEGTPWVVTSSGVQAGDITHNGTSTIVLSNIPAGTLNFNMLISSEQNYDFGTIYVNGEQYFTTSGYNYYNAALPLTESSNTVAFTYSKDGSVDSNDDTLALSNFSFDD